MVTNLLIYPEINQITLLSGNFKADWRWDVSKETFPKDKFDSYVKSVFSKIDFYKHCGVINTQNANTAYFVDTDGRVVAVLYALLVSGHIGIREKGWSLLCELLKHENMASSAYKHKNNKVLYDLLNTRDMILNFYKQCGVINPQNANTAYFGDTDGRVGAVLYALLVSGHIGIREKGWSLLCDLLEHEDMASFAYENKKLKKLFTLLDKRDMFLNELHQHVFLKGDAITPCIFLGDHTGDRFSTIFGDKYILTLLNSMRNMEGNKDSRIIKNVVFLAGNHEINFNGNYSARLANHKLSSGDTYNLIKTLDVCNYDSETKVLTSHHGIIRNEENECYCLGALQVPFNQMKDPIDPEELANIFNKKHKQHMDDRLIHLIRSNAIASTPVYDNYFNNTNGIIRDEEKKCYCLGALQVPFNQMKNPTDPEELANIFNKKHKEHMDDPLFHLIRSNTLKPTPVYANYFDNTTDFRPARERIFICGETLKGEDPSKYIRQKYGHHGPGVDHNQQFDNGIMGLNSLKEARDKNNKIIYSSGLSCFQSH